MAFVLTIPQDSVTLAQAAAIRAECAAYSLVRQARIIAEHPLEMFPPLIQALMRRWVQESCSDNWGADESYGFSMAVYEVADALDPSTVLSDLVGQYMVAVSNYVFHEDYIL